MKLKIILLILVSLFSILSMSAQSEKQIKEVFDLYGKRKGTTMVQLASDILGSRSRMTLYKSLVVDRQDDVLQSISKILDNENKNLTEISVVRKSGKIVNGVYFLPLKKKTDKQVYEYILYSYGSKLTFVYLQGSFPPEELDRELKKLKELFIYIKDSK